MPGPSFDGEFNTFLSGISVPMHRRVSKWMFYIGKHGADVTVFKACTPQDDLARYFGF
jgi:hypothetical protein